MSIELFHIVQIKGKFFPTMLYIQTMPFSTQVLFTS